MAFLFNFISLPFFYFTGTREKALLDEDSALNRFKSHKKGVHKLKRIGDVLTVVVVAGSCYEIYVKAVMRKEALAVGKSS